MQDKNLKKMELENKREAKVISKNIDVFYGDKQALFGIDLEIYKNEVTALIGPSGCGKSTFLRCINRMNDVIDICKITGEIEIDNFNIYKSDVDVVRLREKVGMVFQKPNPFPKVFMTMLHMVRAFMELLRIKMKWIKL